MKDKGKLLVWFLIGSETFFFIALIISYVYYRNFTETTDTVAESLEAVRSGLFTVLLIASSFTLILARRFLIRKNYSSFRIFMGLSILLGSIFMFGQITEYIGLYEQQITMDKDVFGSSFFTLTGFHGFHVILGIISMIILFILSFGKLKIVTHSAMEGVDLYWHFVDIVWIFVFFFVYITPLL